MPDNSESDKLADLTHQYHEKYRTSGTALCISLATLASADGWWFYNHFIKDLKIICNNYQTILCCTVIISAITLILSSFFYQFINYHGRKHMARSFCHSYKFNFSQRKDEDSNSATKKEWKASQTFFKIADWVIKWPIAISTIVNFIAAIIYIALYQPNPLSIK